MRPDQEVARDWRRFCQMKTGSMDADGKFRPTDPDDYFMVHQCGGVCVLVHKNGLVEVLFEGVCVFWHVCDDTEEMLDYL